VSFLVVLDTELAAPVFRRLPPTTKQAVKAGLRLLREDPFETNPNADIMLLDGSPGEEPVYRLRVGNWRVVFTRDGATVKVIRIFHREEGYDWLDG
jgi:mRNA interferase RelE/StbE